MKARGWYKDRMGAYYTYVPTGHGKRKNVRLSTCTTDAQAEARAAIVRALAKSLRDAKKDEYLEKVIAEAGAADEKTLTGLRRLVDGIIKGVERSAAAKAIGKTWRDVAKMWTDGDLHRLHPDQVPKKRTTDMDVSRIKVLNDLIGDVLITDPEWLEHAEEAMRNLPDRVQTSATRRQYAQCLRRVLELSVYPLKLIPTNPLPRGFLPKIKQDKAMQMLYPNEEEQLMAAQPSKDKPGVPLAFRMAYGFLARMGFRKSEIVGSEEDDEEDDEPMLPIVWGQLDLERRIILRGRSKNDPTARPIVLDEGVTKAFAAWKKIVKPKASDAVFVDDKGRVLRLHPETFREHLKLAGVTRPELFERKKGSQPIRVHDLRALFVTISLAEGKGERWVKDRTSHTTDTMLEKYRRLARSYEELKAGPLTAMDEAIPEFRKTVGEPSDGGPKGPQGSRRAPNKARKSGRSRSPVARTQSFGSSYQGSNPCVGTSQNTGTCGDSTVRHKQPSDGSSDGLAAALELARRERRWADVARLADALAKQQERE